MPRDFAERQRAGQAGGGGVDDAVEMGIVEIEAVDQHAVGERRVAHRQANVAADHAAGSLAAQRRGAGDRDVGEVVGIGREAAAQRIEDQELGAMQHRRRNIFERQVGGKLGQRSRRLRRRRRRMSYPACCNLTSV